jgi:hypothetical protein
MKIRKGPDAVYIPAPHVTIEVLQEQIKKCSRYSYIKLGYGNLVNIRVCKGADMSEVKLMAPANTVLDITDDIRLWTPLLKRHGSEII